MKINTARVIVIYTWYIHSYFILLIYTLEKSHKDFIFPAVRQHTNKMPAIDAINLSQSKKRQNKALWASLDL